MDDFTYNYTPGKNRLLSLKENQLTEPYAGDIKPKADQTPWTYAYDSIGRLTRDENAGIARISWTVDSKVSEVKRVATSNQEDVRFVYDAMGRRIQKTVIGKVLSNGNYVPAAASTWKHTFYTYDASGNPMGIYSLLDTQLKLEEQTIYGAARVGTVTRSTPITNNLIPSYRHTPGLKTYELANHLGNVLVTVSDARAAINNAGLVARYEAKYVTYSDYYPFGMQMPGRKGGSGYRYGFQGQERDDEIKGEGNSLNYEYRMHDPRIGRFFAIDPLTSKYPHYTPYAFSGNRVMDAIELEGLEPSNVHTAEDLSTSTAGFGNEREYTYPEGTASAGTTIWTVDNGKYWIYYQNIGQQEISTNNFQWHAAKSSDPTFIEGWHDFTPQSESQKDDAYVRTMNEFVNTMQSGSLEVAKLMATAGFSAEWKVIEVIAAMGTDAFSQAMAANGDFSAIDYADVALAGAFEVIPGEKVSHEIGKAVIEGFTAGAIDVKYNNTNGITVKGVIGEEKKLPSILLDGTFNTLGNLGAASFGPNLPVGFQMGADFVTGVPTNAVNNTTNEALGY
jgi:RHS repeat-associated protein